VIQPISVKEKFMETTTLTEMSSDAAKPSVNPDALNRLLGQMVNDLGAPGDLAATRRKGQCP
jgi:hypothetical protein